MSRKQAEIAKLSCSQAPGLPASIHGPSLGRTPGERVMGRLARHRSPGTLPPGVAMSRYAIFEAARFMLCCALAGSAVGFLVGLMRGER